MTVAEPLRDELDAELREIRLTQTANRLDMLPVGRRMTVEHDARQVARRE